MANRTVLAIDLGAESGRVVAVHFDGKRLTAEEVHRFPNVPVEVHGTVYWDTLRLWHDMQDGIRKVKQPDSLALDGWGVDFALLDRCGHLVGPLVHYRDRRTEGMIDYVFSKMPRSQVFERTGIQTMSLNTLFQLASLAKNDDPSLAQATSLVAHSDLLYYWLTGVKVNEFTVSTTTQVYNPRAGNWAFDVLEAINVPTKLFGPITRPGVILGKYESIPVVLAPHHDTASAVVGVPASTPNFAYLSSGTWSLLGVELDAPVINEAVMAANLTNEGGFGGTFRFLKNIMGLWLLQESRRRWAEQGQNYTYDQLTALAQQAAPFVSLVDPDNEMFLAPGDIPGRIAQFCQQTGQPVPDSPGALARCVFESLALKYRHVIRLLTALTGRTINVLHIVGGGAQNTLLCQMAADATGCVVVAGPGEATALGNAIVQLIALGDLKSAAEGRALIRDSFPLATYEPHTTAVWDAVEARYQALMDHA